MTFPSFESLMRPVLERLAQESPQRTRDVVDQLADAAGLTDDQRAETYPSGQKVFANRVQWAVSHLFQAGLISRPHRGVIALTPAGSAALASHQGGFTMKALLDYPSYVAFRSKSKAKATATSTAEADPVADEPSGAGSLVDDEAEKTSPLALVAQALAENRADVEGELLERAHGLSPTQFEALVLAVLEGMGYGERGSLTQTVASGDGGIDGIISQDPLGLDRIYLQAKRYAAEHSVGRPELQGFVGALASNQGDRGVFITTSTFTKGARETADKVSHRVELVDGPRLAGLMLRHGVGVQAETTVTLHRLDEDFFEGL